MTSQVLQKAYFETEQNFQQERVEQSSPLELTCLLYEGAIQAVDQAVSFLRRGDIMARGRSIARAQGILLELIESLNRRQGGDIANRLGLLYDYMLSKLAEAHKEQSADPLIEVQRLLSQLLSAWQQITPAVESAARSAEDGARIDCNV